MQWTTLATDFDGTLANGGRVRPAVLLALRRLRATGRKLVLVTGRELEELLRAFRDVELFDRVVAESGALLYRAEPTPRECPLARPPPSELAADLRARGVVPLACGRIVLSMSRDHETDVRELLRERGLALHVVVDKSAAMVLPAGIDKGTGLRAALGELGVDESSTVAVGDGEDDGALLDVCGLRVAVANAVPTLRARAQVVTRGARGEGVVELCERLMAAFDLDDLDPSSRRTLSIT